MLLTRRDILAASLAALAGPVLGRTPPLVFAAASLKGVLDRISEKVVPMRLSYGGSGAMARQIIQGAPADLFLPANPVWMEAVAAQRPPLARRDLLGNRLVLVAGAGVSPTPIAQWQTEDRLAMGFVEAVPAGQYGRAALHALGLWDRAAPHVVETDSVAAALALVTSGALPYAIVYATDAAAQPDLQIVQEFGAELHPPIIYPLAVMTVAGRPVYDALNTPGAAAIFRDAAFEVI